MKIRDKNLKEAVDVRDDKCLKRECYWPRTDPGLFTKGQGYRSRSGGKTEWLCGTREAEGCPDTSVPVLNDAAIPCAES